MIISHLRLPLQPMRCSGCFSPVYFVVKAAHTNILNLTGRYRNFPDYGKVMGIALTTPYKRTEYYHIQIINIRQVNLRNTLPYQLVACLFSYPCDSINGTAITVYNTLVKHRISLNFISGIILNSSVESEGIRIIN